MKLVITEYKNGLIEIEKKVTTVVVAPFDTAVGAIPLSLITAAGQLIVGSGNADAEALPAGNDGDVLTFDSAVPLKVKWASGGQGASALMYNMSGGSVVAGDVIINDYSNDRSFSIPAARGDGRVIGVAGESIASTAEGKVLTFWGTITNVNVDTAAVNRGDFLIASNTSKRATSIGPVRQGYGVFALALSSKAAGSVGTVQALLVPQIFSGASATSAFVAGGYSGGASWLDTTEKFTFASSVWGAILTTLSAGVYGGAGATNEAIAGYQMGGRSSVSSSTTHVNKMPYSTELFSNLGSVLAYSSGYMFSSVMNAGVFTYVQRAQSGGTYYTSVTKFTFASDTGAASSTLSAIRGYCGTLSDGSVSGIFQAGQSSDAPALSIVTDKVTFATDTIAALTAARPPAAITLLRPMNFVAAGVSYSAANSSTLGNKLSHATWTNVTLSSQPVVNCTSAAVACDGVATAFLALQLTSQSFSRVTETFTSTPGATTLSDRVNPISFSYGVV